MMPRPTSKAATQPFLDRRTRELIALVLLGAPALLLLSARVALRGWALYSEAEVLDANVLHPLFTSSEHFAEEHWRPEMRQRERLEALSMTIHATAAALQKLGITAFLESGNLIGWLRHGGGQMPWDTDGDVGMLAAECRGSNASKADFAAAIGPDFEVLKFGCTCEEQCEGDNKRMAGRVAHRLTGVCVDVFAYAPVRELRPWQRAPRYAGVDWWERVDDHADYTFPGEVLLPLQRGLFAGAEIALPRDPRDFLSWEYGQCLGVHVWPWRLLLYTPVSVMVPVAVIAKSTALLSGPVSARSPWFAALVSAYAAAALSMFRGGLAIVALFVVSLCELGVSLLRPWVWAPQVRFRHRMLLLITMGVLVFELRGSVEQLLCQVDDFHLRPRRPKSWTLCLLGKCWDF